MNDQAELLRSLVAHNINDKPIESTKMKVITIASGKGGVGKSNFSVNLALSLQKLGKKPIILDADFGLANVEIILGERPKYNLANVLSGQCEMKEIITKSKYDISFISGGSGIKEMMFLTPAQIDKLSRQLEVLEEVGDTLIVDTGAGINDIVLKFCNLAQEIYIVITPEPTSITDGYALIKTIASKSTEDTNIKIIINKAVSREEATQVFNNLFEVAKAFLKIEIQYGGYIPYDEKLFMAVKAQVPVSRYDEKAKSSIAYKEIAQSFCNIPIIPHKNNWLSKFKNLFSH